MPSRTKSQVDILVVEDTLLNWEFVKTILIANGYSVALATDGRSGIDKARELNPKLLLLDVGLPDMDGYAVCSALKAEARTKDIPVIFVTGHDSGPEEARSFEVGGADFIAKPIRPLVLLARIKAHIDLQSQRRSVEGMFRDVIEFAPAIFFLTDEKLTVIQTNARAISHFGCERAVLLGEPLQRFIPECARYMQLSAARPDLPPTLWPTPDMGGAVPSHAEVACLRPDGSAFTADATFSMLPSARRPVHVVVLQDATERLRRLKELQDSRLQLREMAADHEATRESERKHIAREVHDELGQVMTALRMDLSFLQMQHGASTPGLPEKLTEMKGLVDRAIAGVRNVAKTLRPEALDMGLGPAIEWLCDEFKAHTGVACALEVQPIPEFGEARSMLIYRIVQESLTNVSRYAHASKVRVVLHAQDRQVHLLIADDGDGFDARADAKRKSYGIVGMRERAITLGGALTIESTPGQGTTVQLVAPLDDLTQKAAP